MEPITIINPATNVGPTNLVNTSQEYVNPTVTSPMVSPTNLVNASQEYITDVNPTVTSPTINNVVNASQEYINAAPLTLVNIYSRPWPMVMVLLVGTVFAIYTGIAPSIDSNKRFFGVILLVLWSLLWSLLLWVLWTNQQYVTAWCVSLIPMITMIVFLVLIVILDY